MSILPTPLIQCSPAAGAGGVNPPAGPSRRKLKRFSVSQPTRSEIIAYLLGTSVMPASSTARCLRADKRANAGAAQPRGELARRRTVIGVAMSERGQLISQWKRHHQPANGGTVQPDESLLLASSSSRPAATQPSPACGEQMIPAGADSSPAVESAGGALLGWCGQSCAGVILGLQLRHLAQPCSSTAF